MTVSQATGVRAYPVVPSPASVIVGPNEIALTNLHCYNIDSYMEMQGI